MLSSKRPQSKQRRHYSFLSEDALSQKDKILAGIQKRIKINSDKRIEILSFSIRIVFRLKGLRILNFEEKNIFTRKVNKQILQISRLWQQPKYLTVRAGVMRDIFIAEAIQSSSQLVIMKPECRFIAGRNYQRNNILNIKDGRMSWRYQQEQG